ncbi:Uncharacterised protein [Myroides odoratus]|nr:hypothetical protein Myrod_3441 [Myroides odoratus DSM 2801]EKB05859.1 hypothetical protein HMPREF9716_02652 [Myroides odoratus CIP 103059]STZ31583.1 Uncharacterised protein [Myroides odoratus]
MATLFLFGSIVTAQIGVKTPNVRSKLTVNGFISVKLCYS